MPERARVETTRTITGQLVISSTVSLPHLCLMSVPTPFLQTTDHSTHLPPDTQFMKNEAQCTPYGTLIAYQIQCTLWSKSHRPMQGDVNLLTEHCTGSQQSALETHLSQRRLQPTSEQTGKHRPLNTSATKQSATIGRSGWGTGRTVRRTVRPTDRSSTHTVCMAQYLYLLSLCGAHSQGTVVWRSTCTSFHCVGHRVSEQLYGAVPAPFAVWGTESGNSCMAQYLLSLCGAQSQGTVVWRSTCHSFHCVGHRVREQLYGAVLIPPFAVWGTESGNSCMAQYLLSLCGAQSQGTVVWRSTCTSFHCVGHRVREQLYGAVPVPPFTVWGTESGNSCMAQYLYLLSLCGAQSQRTVVWRSTCTYFHCVGHRVSEQLYGAVPAPFTVWGTESGNSCMAQYLYLLSLCGAQSQWTVVWRSTCSFHCVGHRVREQLRQPGVDVVHGHLSDVGRWALHRGVNGLSFSLTNKQHTAILAMSATEPCTVGLMACLSAWPTNNTQPVYRCWPLSHAPWC